MSFSRILPDSSNSPGVILKFFSKFGVRMNYHKSYVFLQDRPHSFHRWLNLFIFDSFGVSQQFTVVFLVVTLNIWSPKKSFTSISYPFSQRFVVLVRGHPLIIVWLWEFFSPIRSNSRVFSVWLSAVHQFRCIHSQLSVVILQSYRCIVQVFSNQLIISSFSYI